MVICSQCQKECLHPHILSCRHGLCLPCVQSLATEDGFLPCPKCEEGMSREEKSGRRRDRLSLLETYLKTQTMAHAEYRFALGMKELKEAVGCGLFPQQEWGSLQGRVGPSVDDMIGRGEIEDVTQHIKQLPPHLRVTMQGRRLDGKPVVSDGLTHLAIAGEKGNTHALCVLGNSLLEGLGRNVAKDREGAKECYAQAAELGHAESQVRLAITLEEEVVWAAAGVSDGTNDKRKRKGGDASKESLSHKVSHEKVVTNVDLEWAMGGLENSEKSSKDVSKSAKAICMDATAKRFGVKPPSNGLSSLRVIMSPEPGSKRDSGEGDGDGDGDGDAVTNASTPSSAGTTPRSVGGKKKGIASSNNSPRSPLSSKPSLATRPSFKKQISSNSPRANIGGSQAKLTRLLTPKKNDSDWSLHTSPCTPVAEKRKVSWSHVNASPVNASPVNYKSNSPHRGSQASESAPSATSETNNDNNNGEDGETPGGGGDSSSTDHLTFPPTAVTKQIWDLLFSARKQNHPAAYYHSGRLYCTGFGLASPDLVAAYQSFRKAASLGHARSHFDCSALLAMGRLKPVSTATPRSGSVTSLSGSNSGRPSKVRDTLQSKLLRSRYEEATDSSSIRLRVTKPSLSISTKLTEQFDVALLSAGEDISQEERVVLMGAVVENLVDGYSQGDSFAQHALGCCYWEGVEDGAVMMVDRNLAVDCWRKAAAAGNVESCYLLGKAYFCGEGGIEKNVLKAVDYYAKAAQSAYQPAVVALGLCFETGVGAMKSESEAERCFRLSAESGDPDGAFYYARYLERSGKESKQSQSSIWYEKCAALGHREGRYHCGRVLYEEGNVKESEEVFWRAFRQHKCPLSAVAIAQLLVESQEQSRGGGGGSESEGEEVGADGASRAEQNRVRKFDESLLPKLKEAIDGLIEMVGAFEAQEDADKALLEQTAEEFQGREMFSDELGSRTGEQVKQIPRRKRRRRSVTGVIVGHDAADSESLLQSQEWVAEAALLIGRTKALGLGGFKKSNQDALEWYRKGAVRNNAECQYKLGCLLAEYSEKLKAKAEKMKSKRMSKQKRDGTAPPKAKSDHGNTPRKSVVNLGEAVDLLGSLNLGRELSSDTAMSILENLNMNPCDPSLPRFDLETFQVIQPPKKKESMAPRPLLATTRALSFSSRLSKGGTPGGSRSSSILGGKQEEPEPVDVIEDTLKRADDCLRESVLWYARSAKTGHVKAACSLGVVLRRGLGVQRDPEAAVAMYRMAALSGNREAQYNLGMCFMTGRGVEKDPDEAVVWLSKAADMTHVDALYELALCFLDGIGVTCDLEMCKSLLNDAAWLGHKHAEERLNNWQY